MLKVRRVIKTFTQQSKSEIEQKTDVIIVGVCQDFYRSGSWKFLDKKN